MTEPEFLKSSEVFYLHHQSLIRHGGSDGIRDYGMIDSALASAKNTWHYGGSLFEIAAAYAFHLAEAQAFIDGNKRAGVAAALAFLRKNNYPVLTDDGSIYEAMIDIANKKITKAGLAKVLQKLAAKSI